MRSSLGYKSSFKTARTVAQKNSAPQKTKINKQINNKRKEKKGWNDYIIISKDKIKYFKAIGKLQLKNRS